MIDLGLTIACGVLALLVFRWRSHWSSIDVHQPYTYFADSLTYGSAVFNAQQGHPFLSDTLGGPLGQQLGLSSYGVEWTPAWFVAHFAAADGGPWPAMYRYWQFSYVAVASATFVALRWLSLARLPAMVAAVAFALLPQHQYNFASLFYANFAAMPLMLVMAIRLAAGADLASLTPVWLPVAGRRRSVVGAALSLGCLALGLLGANYYMIFSLFLLGSASLVLLARRRWWPRAGRMALVTMFAGLPLAVSYLPVLIGQARAAMGPEDSQSDRRSFAAYANGGDPFALITPLKGGLVFDWLSGSTRLGRFFQEYDSTPMTTGSEYVYFRGGVAVMGAVLVVAIALVGGHRRGDVLRRVSPLPSIHKATLFILVLAISWYSRGGLGTLTGFVLPQVRGYARAVLLVIFTSLALLALVAGQRGRVAWPVRGLAMILLSLSLVESVSANVPLRQVSPTSVIAVDSGLRRPDGFGLELRSLSPAGTQRLVAAAQSRLSAGCTVLTLPLVKYPVDFGLGVTSFFAYEQLKPGLLPSGVRWTGGGLAGTPHNAFTDRWLEPYAAGAVRQVLAAGDREGFCGALLLGGMHELFYQAGRPGVTVSAIGGDISSRTFEAPSDDSRFRMPVETVEAALVAHYGPPCYLDEKAQVSLFCADG